MSNELVCVFRATDVAEADIVAAWLNEQGITTHVSNRLTIETLPLLSLVAPKGVEVCVPDGDQAALARELLAEHDQEVAGRPTDTPDPCDDSGAVEIACPKCEEPLWFDGTLAGSVRACPHCGEEIRVPDSGDA